MVKVTDKDYYLDGILRSNLNGLIDNVKDDWNFTILITGSGQTRVGKSCLAMQIGYYLSSKLGTKFTLENNICLTSRELQKNATKSEPYSSFVYDEARRGLSSEKRYYFIQQDLMDFFNECGQLNQIFIVVCPDYFDLRKELAVGLSHCLINVRYKTIKSTNKAQEQTFKLQRGYFDFYSMSRKRQLFIKGKKYSNSYTCVKPNFFGRFTNFWTIDKEKYMAMKTEYFKTLKGEATTSKSLENMRKQRDAIIYHLHKKEGLNQIEIENLLASYHLKLSRSRISLICTDFPRKMGLV